MSQLRIGIIGLGIGGLSIAAKLAEAGHSVHGFEQFSLLHARGGSHGEARLFRRFPGEGELYAKLGNEAYHGWRRWNEEAGEPLFVECGGIDAAPAGDKHLLNVQKFTSAYGAPLDVLSGAEVKARHPCYDLPDDWIAVYQPTNGYTRADATKSFLARKAEAAGATLQFNILAGLQARTTILTLDGKDESFDRIIVAAGPWITKLVPQLSMLTPERRVLSRLTHKGGSLPVDTPIYSVAGEIYASPTRDGQLSLGKSWHFREAVDPDHVASPNAQDKQILQSMVRQWLSGMEAAETAETAETYETGTVIVAPDTHFVIGPHPENDHVLLFSACSGHGFKYAPVYGDIVADWVRGIERPDLNLFRADRYTHG